MSGVQFSLFFVALLVGYLLVHLRLARFEEHMKKLAGIRTLDDRLKVLVEAIDKLRLDRLEAKLDRLHEDLEDLREATVNVQDAVVSIPPPTQYVVADREPARGRDDADEERAVGGRTAAARTLGVVEARLLALGYGNIQVLSDLSRVAEHGDADVLVECDRGGMPHKGQVIVRNFGVRDVGLQTVAPMFP